MEKNEEVQEPADGGKLPVEPVKWYRHPLKWLNSLTPAQKKTITTWTACMAVAYLILCYVQF